MLKEAVCFSLVPRARTDCFGNAADEDDELMMEVTVVTSQKVISVVANNSLYLVYWYLIGTQTC